MDKKLIDEIIARVAAKMAEGETGAQICRAGDADKPGLLVLTQEHGNTCHPVLESKRLMERFHTECAMVQEYKVDSSAYEVVVLFQLTNEALCKLASGICDTPYTSLASRAILQGKRIYLPKEEVELFQYEQTAPAPYYAMLKEKLDLLVASGVVLCDGSALEDAILSGQAPAPVCACAKQAVPAPAEPARERTLHLEKKVLTERDVRQAGVDGYSSVHVPQKCILTALAKDTAKDLRIQLVRD